MGVPEHMFGISTSKDTNLARKIQGIGPKLLEYRTHVAKKKDF